ncbi:alkaline phosphatase [Alteromonas pelagimontana]|nr:alkaline phosphatase [Alteromonas pelagimontana]
MAKPQQNTEEARQFPRNIIMVIADGMGPAYTTAYRNFSDDPNTDMVEPVIFDDIFVGNASTYPASESGYVTDSAAAATALATGIKTYNGAIGVDVNKQPVESVLQRAKTLGLRTGLAVTSQINHATPAAYIAHNESRQNYPQIADSFFDSRVDNQLIADVMLGGGTRYFNREDRDVTAEFINAGYEFAEQYDDLLKIDEGSNVLGLFAEVGLPPALDDPKDDRLAFLTKHAIRFLENPNGFFLLVEASQVDWAGHSNDIASVVAEMDDLAQTLDYLQSYVAAHPDTLVILTADHNTGGLTIGADGEYHWDPAPLHRISASVTAISKDLVKAADVESYVSDKLGFTLNAQETAQLEQVKLLSVEEVEKVLKYIIDKRTNTGWTTTGHTGTDVEVFAFGKQSQLFTGQIDNTDIAKHIFDLLDRRTSS